MAVGGDDDSMERDFAARLRLAHSPSPATPAAAASSPPTAAGGIAFRAPQEQFTADDFVLGKIYGVGSYSKVLLLLLTAWVCHGLRGRLDRGTIYSPRRDDEKKMTGGAGQEEGHWSRLRA